MHPEYKKYKFTLYPYSDEFKVSTDNAIKILQKSNDDYVRLVFSYYH